jgi:hypothetical protein
LGHAAQHGQLAFVVEVHAHAQVHLGGVGVGVELLVQTQDRVTGGHFNGVKIEADMVCFLLVGSAGGGQAAMAAVRYAAGCLPRAWVRMQACRRF